MGGIITNVKPFRSKKSNEPMAFLTLEDLSGKNVAVTVFPSVFKDYAAHVEKDKVVILRGRISCRERVREDEEDERKVELLADSFQLLGNGVSQNNTSSLHIRLDPGKRNYLSLLRETLERHNGEASVFVHVCLDGSIQKVQSRLMVEPNDALRQSLERIVGKQAFWVE
jgi:DNA polymerase III alpha subunit